MVTGRIKRDYRKIQMKATSSIEKPIMTLSVKEWTRKERWIVIVAIILKRNIAIYRGIK